MDERLRFVAKLLEGEAMTDACREFGISRKTGYKIFNRYKESGLESLRDRSRRPVRYANQLPPQLESLIVSLKREKPHWGARKIRELLVRRLDGDVRISAKSTIHAVLHRSGLVKGVLRRRHRAVGTCLSPGAAHQGDVRALDSGTGRRGRRCVLLAVGHGPSSIADEFRAAGVDFDLAKKADRVAGWQVMRRLLQDAGKPDVPGLYIARRCEYFWSTVSYPGRDPRYVEDLDSRAPITRPTPCARDACASATHTAS